VIVLLKTRCTIGFQLFRQPVDVFDEESEMVQPDIVGPAAELV